MSSQTVPYFGLVLLLTIGISLLDPRRTPRAANVPSLNVEHHLTTPGQSVSLTCTKPDQATEDVVWDRESQAGQGVIAIGGVIQGDPAKYDIEVFGVTQTLTVKDIVLDDDDLYRCYTVFQTDYDYYNLSVIIEPQHVSIKTPPWATNEDQYAEIDCTVGPSKPAADVTMTLTYANGDFDELTSTSEDTNHPNGTVTRESQVYIVATRDVLEAVIQCHATIQETDYQGLAEAQLEMNVRPQTPYLRGFEQPVISGDVIQLDCHAPDAIPAAEVTWYWDGAYVKGRVETSTNKNGTVNVVSTVELTATPIEDKARFECRVINEVMQDAGESAIVLQESLVVHFPPVVLVDDTSKTGREGEVIDLQCIAASNPDPLDSWWTHDGQSVTEDDRHVIDDDVTAPDLTISNLHYEDKGTYHCRSRNVLGTSHSQSVRLLVEHAAVCRRQKLKFAATLGQTVTLTCYLEAHPNTDLVFGWLYYEELDMEAGIADPSDDQLAYSYFNYTVQSMGDYTNVSCLASNGIGSMKEPCVFHVMPPGPAEAPSDCQLTFVNGTSLSLACWEEFDGGSQPSYWLQSLDSGSAEFLVRDDGDYRTLANETVPEFTVDSLQPETTYLCRVCASNADFWQDVTCTQQFEITTTNETLIIDEIATSSSTVYIIAGVLAGVVLIALIVCLILAILLSRRQAKKVEDSDSETDSCSSIESIDSTDRSAARATVTTGQGELDLGCENPGYCTEEEEGVEKGFVAIELLPFDVDEGESRYVRVTVTNQEGAASEEGGKIKDADGAISQDVQGEPVVEVIDTEGPDGAVKTADDDTPAVVGEDGTAPRPTGDEEHHETAGREVVGTSSGGTDAVEPGEDGENRSVTARKGSSSSSSSSASSLSLSSSSASSVSVSSLSLSVSDHGDATN